MDFVPLEVYRKANTSQQWRSTSKMDETRTQDWEQQTFMHWLDLVKRVPAEETGLEVKQRNTCTYVAASSLTSPL